MRACQHKVVCQVEGCSRLWPHVLSLAVEHVKWLKIVVIIPFTSFVVVIVVVLVGLARIETPRVVSFRDRR